MNETYFRLLEVAKAMTGSSEIDVIIDAAHKIAKAIDHKTFTWDQVNNYVETGYVHGTLTQFINQCRIPHPQRGAIPFILYPFQSQLCQTLSQTTQSRVFINSSRQMGITTILSAYALHEAVEKDHQTILICANKFAQAQDIMRRIHFMADTTTAWLPKTVKRNKSEIEFENGSQIIARPFSSNSLCGLSLTHCIVDQAAYIPFAHEDEFYIGVSACLYSHGRLIMSSTPNTNAGLFYRLWSDNTRYPAERITVSWNDHPERDEAWADSRRNELGTKRFAAEFENQFMIRE